MKAEQLIEEAERLPEADRIRLAERVLASFDGEPDRDAADAWADEIERRTREIEQGLVEPIPWSEVKERSARKARGRRSGSSPWHMATVVPGSGRTGRSIPDRPTSVGVHTGPVLARPSPERLGKAVTAVSPVPEAPIPPR